MDTKKQSQDIKPKTTSIQKLSEIYYNPREGLSSINNLIAKARGAGITSKDLTNKEITEWLKLQPLHQTTSAPTIADRSYSIPFRADGIGRINADLIDLTKFGKFNSNNKWLFVALDVYSRYAWAYPAKTKSPESVLPELTKVVNYLRDLKKSAKSLEKPSLLSTTPFEDISLTTDSGTEWLGVVKKFCQAEGITQFFGNPKDSTQNRTNLIERFNRTITGLITTNNKIKGTKRYIDDLDDLIANYNNNFHTGIKAIPLLVLAGLQKPSFRKAPGDDFPEGTQVRVLKTFKKFAKKSRETLYSDEVLTIKENRDQGARYLLSDGKEYLPSQFKIVPKGSSEVNFKPEVIKKTREMDKQINDEATFKRRIKKEGIEPSSGEKLPPGKRFTGKYSK